MKIYMEDKDEAIVQGLIYSPFKTNTMKRHLRMLVASLFLVAFLFVSVAPACGSGMDPTLSFMAFTAVEANNDMNFVPTASTAYISGIQNYGFCMSVSPAESSPMERCNDPPIF